MSSHTPSHDTNRLPAGALPCAAGGLLAAVGLAWVTSQTLGASDAYPVTVAVTFAAVLLVALPYSRTDHPHGSFGPANHVTTARALLMALIAAGVGERPTPELALTGALVGTVALGLDGVDGWLARRSGLSSPFGARFDMEVDALLIFVLCLLVWHHDKAGAWVLVSGLLRYAFMAAGWTWPWMRRDLPPSTRRKTTCVVQILALLVALTPAVASPWSDTIAAASVVTLCYSFLVDVRWLWRAASRPAAIT